MPPKNKVRYWINRVKYFNVKRWKGGTARPSFIGIDNAIGLEILNNDYTPAELVVRILQRCFGMERSEAIHATLKVHNTGSAIAGYASADVAADLAEHVMKVARQRGFQLQCRPVRAQQGTQADRPEEAGPAA